MVLKFPAVVFTPEIIPGVMQFARHWIFKEQERDRKRSWCVVWGLGGQTADCVAFCHYDSECLRRPQIVCNILENFTSLLQKSTGTLNIVLCNPNQCDNTYLNTGTRSPGRRRELLVCYLGKSWMSMMGEKTISRNA